MSRRGLLETGSTGHRLALFGVVVFFIAGGLGHFLLAHFFVAIVPAYLPAPHLLVAISGACELAGAIGLLWPRTRPWAGLGLWLLVIAVFPANLQMAWHPDLYPAFAPWVLYLRLPLQLLILAWIGVAIRRFAPAG